MEQTGGIHDYGQDFRNNSILDYQLAIKEICNQGGWVIKMGTETNETIKFNEKVIDYSKYTKKNDRLDTVLFAKCKFVLCSSSGVISMSNMFGVPAAISNIVPLSHVFLGPYYNICIPKLYLKEGKLMNFSAILKSNSSNFRTTNEFNNDNIELLDNESDEILNLVKEMLYMIDNKKTHAKYRLDKDIEKFRSMFDSRHYTYKGSANISLYFINKYKYLIYR